MKILIVSDAWLPQINGVVRTLQRTSVELCHRGHEVDVIGPDRFRTIPCPTYPEIRLAINALWKLPAMIRAANPDAIHIATEGPLGQICRRFCVKQSLPFTTSYHTQFPEYVHARCRLPVGLSYRFLRRFHGAADKVMVATPSMQKSLENRGFTQIARWSRGVDTEIFKPAANESDRNFLGLPRPLHLYVGRVAVEKNIRQFLQLDLPGSKLVVGDGPQLAALKSEYSGATFVGAKTGADLVRHYQAADVFVFPSRTDTFGLVLLEAMACGVPVAAFPVPGPIDVVDDGEVGALNEDLALAVQKASGMSRQACREFALSYSWERAVDQFLDNLSPTRPSIA